MHYGASVPRARAGAFSLKPLSNLLLADGRLAADGKEFDSSRKRGQPFVFTGT